MSPALHALPAASGCVGNAQMGVSHRRNAVDVSCSAEHSGGSFRQHNIGLDHLLCDKGFGCGEVLPPNSIVDP